MACRPADISMVTSTADWPCRTMLKAAIATRTRLCLTSCPQTRTDVAATSMPSIGPTSHTCKTSGTTQLRRSHDHQGAIEAHAHYGSDVIPRKIAPGQLHRAET